MKDSRAHLYSALHVYAGYASRRPTPVCPCGLSRVKSRRRPARVHGALYSPVRSRHRDLQATWEFSWSDSIPFHFSPTLLSPAFLSTVHALKKEGHKRTILLYPLFPRCFHRNVPTGIARGFFHYLLPSMVIFPRRRNTRVWIFAKLWRQWDSNNERTVD